MFHVHAWGFPWAATLAGVKQVYPGRYDPARAVLLDATFATSAERSAAAGVAAEVGVAFAGLFLDALLATCLERIASRRADASDADAGGAPANSGVPEPERMGGGGGLGKFERHNGACAGAAQERMTKAVRKAAVDAPG